MAEKTFFPKGRSLKVLQLQKSPFLPFLPGLPLNKSFSQEFCSLVIPRSGMLVLNSETSSSPGFLKDASCSQHRGWWSPVLLFSSNQLPEWIACRVKLVAELLSVCSVSANREREGAGMESVSFFLLKKWDALAHYSGRKRPESGDHKEIPISLKAGKLCFQKAIRIVGQLPLHVPLFPLFFYYSAGARDIACEQESSPISMRAQPVLAYMTTKDREGGQVPPQWQSQHSFSFYQ